MSDYRHRGNAKIIAWIDFIFTLIIFILLVISGIFVLREHNDITAETDLFTSSYISFMMLALVLEIICKVFQLSASIVLIRATDIGRDPRKALSMIEYWRWVTVIEFIMDIQEMLVLVVCYNFIQGFLRGLCLMLELIPILFVLMVNDFVWELKHRLRLHSGGDGMQLSTGTIECGQGGN